MSYADRYIESMSSDEMLQNDPTDVYSIIKSWEIREFFKNHIKLDVFEREQIILKSFISMQQKINMIKELALHGTERETAVLNEHCSIFEKCMTDIFHPVIRSIFIFECLAAIKAARRLMLKYHIFVSEEMIENQNKQQVLRKMSKKELRFKRMPLKQHHLVLAGILAKYFRCKSVYHCGEVSKIIFIGFEEDAYAALALLEYLIRFMEQGAGKYAERQNQDCSWREGFCIGVLEAFHKLNAKKISVKRRPQSSLDGNVYANGKIRGKQAVDERSLSCKE